MGNHVHSCLKVHITALKKYTEQTNHITMLCDSVPAIAHQHCPSLVTQAQQIADKHRQALLLFSVCHNTYVQNYVNTSELDQLGKYRIFITAHVAS